MCARRGAGMRCPLVLLEILVLLGCRVAECRMASDAQQRFSSLPIYLPVSYKVQNAESAFFLKEAGQELLRNGSMQIRSEPFVLHRPGDGIPFVNSSYGNLTAEAPVPLELLQASPPLLSGPPSQVCSSWKVRAHVVTPRVGSRRPQAQVLLYLAGRRWDEMAVPAELLPCIRVFAVHEAGEVAAGCRLEGSLGICVVELELPSTWFGAPPGRKKAHGADLYYAVLPLEGGSKDCTAKHSQRGRSASSAGRQSEAAPYSHRIGWLELYNGQDEGTQAPRLRLDENIEIQAPPSPVRQGQMVSFRISVTGSMEQEEHFILRALFREGLNFVGLRPSNPVDWELEKELLPGSSALSIFCQRKAAPAGDRSKLVAQELMQVEFEVSNFISLQATQLVRWQIEYPGSSGALAEVDSYIYISQRPLQGIVPLAEDTEILNTAILTGRRVVVPVKLVTVEQDGTVREVVEQTVSCRSTNEDVIKVSHMCNSVLVNGKEMSGRQSVRVNFTFMHLSTALEMTVWVPRLPLQIEVSDTELSQVKGWRVPILSNKRPTRDSEDDDDDERKGKGCALQYQYALVRVLTHFVAEPANPGSDLQYMLGPDWQADITDLVVDYLKLDDPPVAMLADGPVLVGKEPGITSIQVLSPLSDSILGEKTITVLEDKVTITDMGVQLVAGLSLSLKPSIGINRAIVATTTAEDLLYSPKQEAIISAWIQFSDGSVTPLNIYDPKDYTMTAVSLDESIISTYQEHPLKWPVVMAEGEGQGPLVRVEMVISEACQKSKRKSVLAVGTGSVRVKFGQNDLDSQGVRQEDGDSNLDNSTGDRKQKGGNQDRAGPDNWKSNSVSSDREEGAMRKVSTTTRTTITHRAGGNKLTGGLSKPMDITSFPAQVELPGGAESGLSQTPRSLSDLEIGMYALLGVFCLAILVFLINCATFAFKYRHKQLPVLEQGNMNHAHDWVWLGNETDLLEHHIDALSPQGDECTTIIDRGEESKYLLNGSIQKNIQGQVHCSADLGPCNGKDSKPEPLNNSPNGKRKRVKFTSFATILPDEGGPYTNSILIGNEDDIKWVCQDMDLGQSAEIRTYMERLQDNL